MGMHADPELVLATLFRRQSGRMIGALVRMLGVQRVDLAEDIVQETLLAALQAWRLGMPRDPEGWLFAVMRNRVRDALRRDRVRARVITPEALADDAAAAEPAFDPDDESGDLLRMMFSCCHPSLTDDGRTALILKLVCGFGTAEVACAFLADRAAMEKRLTRAKKVLADDGVLYEVSTPEQARERLPAVMTALYLMFDAGYHGSATPEPIRADLCAEAIRLATLLVDAPATSSPEVHALVALMCLHAARMPARLDAAGSLVPFERQDRTLWDGELVSLGMQHLGASANGGELTAYHLEAGIAAQHAMARSVRETPWSEIARLYDLLYARKRTPVVALGRAIARAELVGPRDGIDEVLAIESREKLEAYPFFWAALGDLALRAGDTPRARSWLERGAATARNDAERAMFFRRLGECGRASCSCPTARVPS
jgi:RNA polymerase sigma factor (sigma-70 family)